MSKNQIAVVAFGGNALIEEGQTGTQEEQFQNAEDASRLLVALVARGFELLIVHGNGPQIGNLLIRVEEAVTKVPPSTQDLCVAETEGSMGYMLEVSLRNELACRQIEKEVATLITLVLVDPDDENLRRPTKPIGPFYSRYRADAIRKEFDWEMVEIQGRGLRRVVPSPRPQAILSGSLARSLLQKGHIVIAGGGGGVPVIRARDGRLRGVEAVIDKDFTSSILADEIDAGLFLILTTVEQVALNYGKKNQVNLEQLTVSGAEEYLKAGHFPPGSMGPKIQSAIEFVRKKPGREVLITTSARLLDGLEGRAGTRIVGD